MNRVIKLIDNQCDRYLIDADCYTLGRQWDNEAEHIVVEKPAFEVQALSTCEMFVKANGQLVDVIQVYDKPIPITSLLTQYRKITIGFSFYNTDGYVKNSEPKDFYFLEAIKPEAFTPTEPQGKDRLNYLLTNGLTNLRWKEGGHNILELVNADSEVIRELELSDFVQEQADLGETNPQSEKYVQNKSTKYLTNEGDGESPYVTETELDAKGYATEEFVKNHVPDVDFSGIEERIDEIANSIPTKTSDIENDGDGVSKFVTEVDFADNTKDFATSSQLQGLQNSISENLLNYYLKTETYSREEVNNIVSSINSMNKEIVDTLPTENIDENTIYLVPKINGSGNDYYDEYLYINEKFEVIGSTQVDLSQYVKFTDLPTETKAGVAKVVNYMGVGVQNNFLYAVPCTDTDISEESPNNYRTLQPRHISKIVKKGLTNSTQEWTDDNKANARNTIGAVGSTDYATGEKHGVVRTSLSHGTAMTPDGIVYINPATTSDIDNKTSQRKPIVPTNLDYAIKRGLSDNKEEWTDEEKTSARALIDAVGKTDYASASAYGILKTSSTRGTFTTDGILYIRSAENSDIDARIQQYRPIVPANLDYAVNSVLKERVTLTLKENGAYTLTINKE